MASLFKVLKIAMSMSANLELNTTTKTVKLIKMKIGLAILKFLLSMVNQILPEVTLAGRCTNTILYLYYQFHLGLQI
jgi:hypothetical protein